MSNVRIIGITRPTYFDDPEDLLSYCARVSNPKNQENFKTGNKLLRYCIKNQHWSVFEMVNVVMEIKTNRDIGRQILRHRSFGFQEFSARYSEVDMENIEFREARLQDKTNRQNSFETDDEELTYGWKAWQDRTVALAINAYKWAIKNGIAKEVARSVLPEGLTPSTMYMNGTLRSWIHYVELRTTPGTQKEHREIAKQAKVLLMQNFDFLKEHWNEKSQDTSPKTLLQEIEGNETDKDRLPGSEI